jgi:hypothetical protein
VNAALSVPARFALGFALAAVPLALGLSVCSRDSSADVVAEPTPNVPSDVTFYTHVLYGGDDAYLIDGRWYRPGAGQWVVFTREPLELALIRRSLDPDRRSAVWSW